MRMEMLGLMNTDSKSVKKNVDRLFVAHCVVSAVCGALAFVFPNVFEWLLIHHGEALALRDNSSDSKVTHLMVRLYGALLLAQAWIVFSARRIEDAQARRALVQAYCLCFALSTIAMLRAVLTEGGNLSVMNWLNILLYAALAGLYGWFVFGNRIKVFEGLDKGFR